MSAPSTVIVNGYTFYLKPGQTSKNSKEYTDAFDAKGKPFGTTVQNGWVYTSGPSASSGGTRLKTPVRQPDSSGGTRSKTPVRQPDSSGGTRLKTPVHQPANFVCPDYMEINGIWYMKCPEGFTPPKKGTR